MLRHLAPAFTTLSWLATLGASAQDARPLDPAACDTWSSIGESALSRTGAWVRYTVRPDEGSDAKLFVRRVSDGLQHVVERGRGAAVTADERWLVCLSRPPRDEVRAARKDKKKPEEQPKATLVVIELATGEHVLVERVKSFRVPEEGGRSFAYVPEPEPKAKPEKKAGAEGEPEEATEKEPEAATEAEEKPEGDKKEKKAKKKDEGERLVVRDFVTGAETTIENVTSYAFTKDGEHLVYTTSTKDAGGDGAFVHHVAAGLATPLLEGEGEYRSIAFDEASSQIAFLSNQADWEADQPRWTLYRAGIEDAAAGDVASAGTAGVPVGFGVSPNRAPRFSESGARLLFGTAPLPEPEPEEVPDDEEVVVDVWNWTDALLQPQQVLERKRELERSYLAVAHLQPGRGSARVVQLATPTIPSVSLTEDADSRYALGTSNLAYRMRGSWDVWVPEDVYRIDVETGERARILEEDLGRHVLSPGGSYVYWWDPSALAWFTLGLADLRGARIEASAGVPHPLQNELHDQPSAPRAYGSAGWLEDDAGLVVYDKHDLWRLDPAGNARPECITEGVGRREDLRFRFVNLDPDARGSGGGRFRRGSSNAAIDPAEPLLLSAFDLSTKRAGFWRDDLAGGEPRELVMDAKRFGTPRRAKDAQLVLYTRQDFREFPDVWVADTSFDSPRRMSNANPQQADYRWGSAELFDWHSLNGEALRGILYKPDDFDPTRAYPLVVYFYERLSDRLHSYDSPTPSRSSISTPFYTSRDYLVFEPDIPYVEGYPGESCEAAILPAIAKLIDTGFVDGERIGVQGHSWGGYQIAHLVTRTNVFAAAVSGAPVSNMTSAYGGIRWGSGRSRMFQYEESQSRLGGTLWEAHNRYIVNSPIFFADRVTTPLVILHNDGDGAVPWYQGIELFVALRRLERPAWMLNYNGEGHGLGKYPNRRDYAIRMSQFFDHYLKDAPAPEWMTDGIPAVRKGLTLGLEPKNAARNVTRATEPVREGAPGGN